MTRVHEAVRRLADVTEEQIGAARTLNGAELTILNDRRVDALFVLQVALAEQGLPEAEPHLTREVRRLAAAEKRLATIANTVLGRIARLDTAAPAPRYDRSGRLG
ncbi:MAG: hypothetical protein ABMB14_28625 [Myxococcota bacterium]